MNDTPIILTDWDPPTYQIDVQALTELLTIKRKNTVRRLLSAIANADEQYFNWISHALEQMDDNDRISCEIENLIFPPTGDLLMSRALLICKSFAVCFEYSTAKCVMPIIVFNDSNPKRFGELYSARLNAVKEIREKANQQKALTKSNTAIFEDHEAEYKKYQQLCCPKMAVENEQSY